MSRPAKVLSIFMALCAWVWASAWIYEGFAKGRSGFELATILCAALGCVFGLVWALAEITDE